MFPYTFKGHRIQSSVEMGYLENKVSAYFLSPENR